MWGGQAAGCGHGCAREWKGLAAVSVTGAGEAVRGAVERARGHTHERVVHGRGRGGGEWSEGHTVARYRPAKGAA